MQTSPFLNQTNNSEIMMELSSKALKKVTEEGTIYRNFFIVNDATGTLVRFAFSNDVIIYGDYIEALEDCDEHQSVKRWKDLTLHQKVELINQVAS